MSYRRKTSKERTQEAEQLLLKELREAYPGPLTNYQLYSLVGGRIDVVALGRLLDRLLKLELIEEVNVKGSDGEMRPGYAAIM
ncbi:hypothetical protein MYX76_12750 [Desulfobacterota bacterium AH_259_B03_O07]|nr:hypothetical protein [Desulfobacterota bacterium AH_259_B03_O07]